MTRFHLSSTTSPRTKSGLWVVTPVGHWLVLHFKACMHPRASIMPLAELHTSAPMHSALKISKEVMILVAVNTLMSSFSP